MYTKHCQTNIIDLLMRERERMLQNFGYVNFLGKKNIINKRAEVDKHWEEQD